MHTHTHKHTSYAVWGNLFEEELEVVMDIFYSLQFGGRGGQGSPTGEDYTHITYTRNIKWVD